jgi:3-deoxy-D-manno-octulosonate 8-phosphate phosphatase (KDO 8-P phosphatase)
MNFFHQNIDFLLSTQIVYTSELAQVFHLSESELEQFCSEKQAPNPGQLIELSNNLGITIDLLLKRDMSLVSEIDSKNISLLILDIDGVMTDGGMYYAENGDEYKKFNAKDGMAIRELVDSDFKVGIISTGHKIDLVKRRANTLGIQRVHVGKANKLDILKSWCAEMEIELSNVAFIGDDINDEAVMSEVGVAACPADAVDRIKTISHVILSKKGGEGCVREFIDDYLTF